MAHSPSTPLQPVSEEPQIVTGSREQLLHLLAEAAEIEHTLMCSYLYAAFSLKKGEDEGLSKAQADAVGRWRKAIMDVAIEEMGHLLLVANLTVAVGGRPHFSRPNFPVSPGYFPSGVVVRLTPFSAETMDHFIFLERPQGVESSDGATFEAEQYSRDQPEQGLMPGGQDYETIGHLYDAIRANLKALARQLGEPGLFVGSAAGQIGRDVIDLEGVEKILTLKAADRAIALIVEQGEGSPSDREVSHYKIFQGIRAELDSFQNDGPAAPAWPTADSPVLRRPPEPEGKVWIDEPETAALLDFGCALYGLLLRFLVQCFGRPEEQAAMEQKAVMDGAMALMHALAETGNLLARRPASPASPGINAGLSFTMLRGVEPLLFGPSETLLLREQLSGIALKASALDLKCAKALLKLALVFSLES